MSPFQVLYGREPPKLPLYTSEDSTLDAVSADLQQRNEILMQVKENLERARTRMKNKAHHGRADFEFAVGDWVMAKLQPYRQQSIALRLHQRLGFKFFGPFQIIEKINAAAYRVRLP